MKPPHGPSNPSAASMLLQLQSLFYLLEIEPGTTILNITCKFCGFALRFDDENLDASVTSAELFAEHLRKRHGKELHDSKIER